MEALEDLRTNPQKENNRPLVMRIVFWGTPESALPFLEHLLKHPKIEVVAVVTQSDKPSERGQKLHASPVKALAERKKLPVLQPASLKDPAFIEALKKFDPECAIVVAYGKILPKAVIEIFGKGVFNIHFSLLPQLRGGAPIQWAILRGDSVTGVTAFRITEAMDAGNIIAQKPLEISSQDNAVSLEEKLIPLGILALDETLERLLSNTLEEKPQTGPATPAPLLKKSDAIINWNQPCEEVGRRVRALVRLGAQCALPDGRTLQVLRGETHGSLPAPATEPEGAAPGTVSLIEKGRGFLVKCGVGHLLILRVRPEGKKEMDAWSFLQGARLKVGDRLV